MGPASQLLQQWEGWEGHFSAISSSDLKHMQMTRSVDSVQFLPFLTTDINNLSWLSYGVLKGDGTLIVVNAIGAVLQTLYILVYLHFSPQKRAVLLQTATLLGVLLMGYGYFWLLVPNQEAQLQQLGLFCSVFTISMYLSPLADLILTSWCPTFQESLPALSASGFSGSTPRSKTETINSCKPEAVHLTTGHLSANLIPKRAPCFGWSWSPVHGCNTLWERGL
uniref:sugar transporter SWEET1 isoform X2 n=1 Tax=Ictidomys tridecemlineatus TaxID=43179 RepID=UPI001A9F9C8B|nr:sugar transporter SWEET1 isoform X2 [Ictidomys tridecemlineatus]